MTTNSVQIDFRGEGAAVRLTILKYERQVSSNVYDANWLSACVEVELQSFRGGTTLSLTTYDLAALHSQLQGCFNSLAGSAQLMPLEPNLKLGLSFARSGRVIVSGEVATLGKYRDSLSFSFESDQTYVAEVLKQLQSSISRFPVRGSD